MRQLRASKYLAFFRLGFTQTWTEPGEVYARVIFLAIILGVLSALWRAVAEAGMPVAASPRTMVWYIAMTEWVLLSAPLVQYRIEEDVRRGDVAYQIARPVSYLDAHFVQGLGIVALRAPMLLVGASGSAFLFGGGLPEEPLRLLRTIGFGAIAIVVLTAYNVLLGLLAFSLGDIAPVQWIWQKLSFVFGGLLLPLTVYPHLVWQVARATPFPMLFAGPASFVLGAPLISPAVLVMGQVGWFVVAVGIARLTFARATKTLQLNGG